jgi:hypothetical protein
VPSVDCGAANRKKRLIKESDAFINRELMKASLSSNPHYEVLRAAIG